MKRILGMATLALVALAGVRCGDGNGPVAGNLSVKLTTPNSGADSAIAFTVTGPAALTHVTAGAGLRVFAQPLGGVSTKFALTGQLAQNAVILTIGVANVNAVGQYSATIEGVARANYQLRALPGGYALSVVR
jgi:hypothetical protein